MAVPSPLERLSRPQSAVHRVRPPTYRVAVADADVTGDGGSLVFMLTRSGAVHAAGSVLFRTAGTAVAPSDYSAGVGRVRFAPSTQ
ncbi:MAG: hypothetical protein ACR2JK_17150 [Geodermatophilaceae bacterium]